MYFDPALPTPLGAGRAGLAFFMCAILTVIAFIDWDTMTIYDSTNVIVALAGVVSYFLFDDISWLDRLIGVFVISLPMYLLVLWKEGAFGGGDIKLFAALGIFMGWKLNLLTFFIAVVTGGLYAGILLSKKKKKRNEHFAFGPFICPAAVIVMFFGRQMIAWYLEYLGF